MSHDCPEDEKVEKCARIVDWDYISLGGGLQSPRLLPGLRCDALVKLDTVCVVFKAAVEE